MAKVDINQPMVLLQGTRVEIHSGDSHHNPVRSALGCLGKVDRHLFSSSSKTPARQNEDFVTAIPD